MYRLIILFIFSAALFSCVEDDGGFGLRGSNENVEGMAPIYEQPEIAYQLSIGEPRDIVNPGKIFTYQNFLIITILNEGFHVIDNTNPVSPNNLFFVNIPGNTDVSVKEDVFFANNYNDIVSFTLTDAREIQVVERLSDAMQNGTAPPGSNIFFECVDPSRGVVVGWEIRTLNRPGCYKR